MSISSAIVEPIPARGPRPASYPRAPRGGWVGILAAAGIALACHTTPVTGRRSFNLFSTSDDAQLGLQAYEQVLAEAEVVASGPDADLVQRTMERLAAVADDPGFDWQAKLLRADETVNAFALPGGKMAVYTGILPVCGGETGLAVVMGHEIGHVVARHGTERMTTGLGVELVTSLLHTGDYADLAQLGLEFLVNRPFGRSQETEADVIGLHYMARAGYDPREAVAFWGRMDELAGDSPPEFLSTHPSHATRVERLQAELPRALEIWREHSVRPSP
jgi:predicted Zn-dependent protease